MLIYGVYRSLAVSLYVDLELRFRKWESLRCLAGRTRLVIQTELNNHMFFYRMHRSRDVGIEFFFYNVTKICISNEDRRDNQGIESQQIKLNQNNLSFHRSDRQNRPLLAYKHPLLSAEKPQRTFHLSRRSKLRVTLMVWPKERKHSLGSARKQKSRDSHGKESPRVWGRHASSSSPGMSQDLA